MAVCQQACHQVRDEIGAVRKYQLGLTGMLSEPSSRHSFDHWWKKLTVLLLRLVCVARHAVGSLFNLYSNRVCVHNFHHAIWCQTSRRTRTPSQDSHEGKSFTLDLSEFQSVPWLFLHTSFFTVARIMSDFLRLLILFGPASLLWERDLRLGEGLKSDPRLGWEATYWA